ncbi:hypothetical protein [Nocardiopsis trehalosi]|uniref:hypothetical protein n=1 Tax=Nocardiopsis trehalosi TaxID=109329 RepID=UPI000A3E46AF|nr:hypothetical protein [Nocardiopsis trehalosi]
MTTEESLRLITQDIIPWIRDNTEIISIAIAAISLAVAIRATVHSRRSASASELSALSSARSASAAEEQVQLSSRQLRASQEATEAAVMLASWSRFDSHSPQLLIGIDKFDRPPKVGLYDIRDASNRDSGLGTGLFERETFEDFSATLSTEWHDWTTVHYEVTGNFFNSGDRPFLLLIPDVEVIRGTLSSGEEIPIPEQFDGIKGSYLVHPNSHVKFSWKIGTTIQNWISMNNESTRKPDHHRLFVWAQSSQDSALSVQYDVLFSADPITWVNEEKGLFRIHRIPPHDIWVRGPRKRTPRNLLEARAAIEKE